MVTGFVTIASVLVPFLIVVIPAVRGRSLIKNADDLMGEPMSDESFPIRFPRDSVILEMPYWVVHETPAWTEHIPFAMWIVSIVRPRVLVELGTHYANSYFAFAQSVNVSEAPTAMYAVDTWVGDDQAGFYGGGVFDAVSAYNDEHYSGFSTLVRSTFDEALEHFVDGEVELLHLDGHHSYESVKHDFESWLAKMSDRGVVLFHDVAVRERGFGVFQLWDEISSNYPSFEFDHSHGLGVLSVGADLPDDLARLFSYGPESEEAVAVRRIFAELGRRISIESRLEEGVAAVQSDAAERIAATAAEAATEIAAVRTDFEERLEAVRVENRRQSEELHERYARENERLEVELRLADKRASSAFDARLQQIVAQAHGGDSR